MDETNVTNADVAESPKAKPAKGALPKAIADAAKSGVAATLADAIAKNLGMTIDKKQFRDTLRRKHGYVSGKHGTKLTLNATVARSMLDHYRDVKKRRNSK
jgi:hypothetical protein